MWPWESWHLKIKNFKICNIACSHPTKFALFRSYGFCDNGKFTFPRSCDLECHVTLKSKKFKICYFASSNPVRVNNSLHFALSLMIPEIKANLNKCSKFDLSWPLSEAWLVAEGHLTIAWIDFVYILILKDLQNFMTFAALVLELSR